MPGKQHTGFIHKLLGMLFLFFNCVCTAAPLIKATSQDYKQAVSMRLMQNSNSETEDESRLTLVSYVNQRTPFSFRKQGSLYAPDSKVPTAALQEADVTNPPFASSRFLPPPGYYAFLFQYSLF